MENGTAQTATRVERIAIALLLPGLVALSWWGMQPPPPVPADAPPEVFSAERAMRHVEAISQAPHPTGSAENDRVREYLFGVMQELGLEPRVESREYHWRGKDYTLHNLVGRLAGVSQHPNEAPHLRGAVLLMAHYDSVAAGPGAADDGAGVAAILEAIRAVRAATLPGARGLHNDVIVLFSDGEELNLLGARATVEQADWIKDVKVVLNFEARGTSGPSIMFEASANWWLIGQLAETPHPIATSLAADIYKRMPNDTDFTVVAGSHGEGNEHHYIYGLNFAFIDGASRYHTAADTPENLSLASLQHHGEYALHLTRRLGEAPNLLFRARLGRGRGEVFFPLPFSVLVVYSDIFVLPLLIISWVALVLAISSARRRNRAAIPRTFGAMVVVLLSVTLCAAITWALLRILPYHRPQPHGPLPDVWQSRMYLLGFMAIAVTIHFGVTATAARRWGVANAQLAAMYLGALAAIVSLAEIPGGNYLFTWPIIAAAIALELHMIAPGPRVWAVMVRFIGSTLVIATTLLLYVPVLYMLTVALSIRAGFIAAGIAAFALAMMSLPLQQLVPRRPWIAALATGAAAVVLLVVGAVASG